MENNNYSLELEEMRLQMAALQKQLDERLKLDEQQLQNSTMKKINSINRYGYFELIGLIIDIISIAIVQYIFHISFEFITCILPIIVLSSLFGFWLANRIRNTDLSKKSVKEITSTLISMKKQYQIYNIIGFIVGFFIIIPGILYEIYVHSFSHFMFDEGFPTCLFICINSTIFISILTIAIIFNTKMYKKQLHNISELIEMIKDKD